MLSSLITFGASWIVVPILTIILFFDAVAYTLVSYSFKLIMIMSQLNMNVFYVLLAPIIDRVKALIMVLIMFKLGVSFLQYIADPDKTKDSKIGGAALVKNIFITVAILGIYSFVFDLGNDLSMLVLGTYGGDAAYKVVSPPEESNGLLARFVFGSNANEFDSENFGKSLAVTTLSLFLNDEEDSNVKSAAIVYNDILANEKEDTDFFDILTLADDIGRTVYYQIPILSTAVGLYLVYNLVKIAIEIGMRMLKIMVLQIIAPIPICSIISEGPNGKMFTGFYQLYISTLISAFMRVGAVYIVTAFIGVFYEEIMTNVTNIFGSTNIQITGFTKVIIIVMVIIAGYKFVNDLPNFLKKVFGDLIPDAGKDGGFGKFLGKTAKSVMGIGTAATAAMASRSGLVGTLVNMVAGGVSGARGDKVADIIKNNRERAQDIRNQGGGLGYGLRAGEQFLGLTDIQRGRSARQSEASKAAENLLKTREAAIANYLNAAGRKFGTKDQYITQECNMDAAYQRAVLKYESAKRTGNSSDAVIAQQTMAQIQKSKKEEFENAAFGIGTVNTTDSNGAIISATDMLDADSSVRNAQRVYRSQGGSGNNYSEVKSEMESHASSASNIDNGRVLGRANRNRGNGGQ